MVKKRNTGIFVNILILIIAILVAVLFFISYIKEENGLDTGFKTSDVNIEVASIQGEKIEDFGNRISDEDKSIKIDVIDIPVLDNMEALSRDSISEEDEAKHYKYYYTQLDDNAKKIYNSIEKNIENIKEGTYIIDIPSEVGDVLDKNYGEEILNEEFQSAWDAIIMDRVELFFIDVSKVTLEMKTTTYGQRKIHKLSMKPNTTTYLEDDFGNKEIINSALLQVKNVKDQIIDNLSGSDYDKIVQVNDWLVDNLEYGTIYGEHAYTLYGALMGRNCVCEGYAEAFKYIMDELQIPCILVTGIGENSEGDKENHEWNYVMLDGNWYAMDVTWNDPIMVGGARLTTAVKHKYILSGQSIYSNHNPNGKISERGMTFTYPELSNSNYR